MALDKTFQYLLIIVAIVAVVGVVVLLLNSANGSGDLSGMATKASCGDGTCTRPEATATSGSRLYCDSECHYSTDTDGDGLYDYQEIHGLKGPITDINDADSDDDGLTDGEELLTYGTNPIIVDTDGDGLSDGAEVDGDATYGYTSDPTKRDTDGDGSTDREETIFGTDPNDSSSKPLPVLPDLAIDSSATAVRITGTAYTYGGILFSQSVIGAVTYGIKNQGTAAVSSGKTRSRAYLYIPGTTSSILGSTISGSSTSFNLAVLATDTTTFSGTSYLYGSPALTFLQGVYSSRSSALDLYYDIDYSASRGYGISESDETNNKGTIPVTVDTSGITFTETECRNNADCPSPCGCGGTATTPAYSCVDMTTVTSGASTYWTYTNTTCSVS